MKCLLRQHNHRTCNLQFVTHLTVPWTRCRSGPAPQRPHARVCTPVLSDGDRRAIKWAGRRGYIIPYSEHVCSINAVLCLCVRRHWFHAQHILCIHTNSDRWRTARTPPHNHIQHYTHNCRACTVQLFVNVTQPCATWARRCYADWLRCGSLLLLLCDKHIDRTCTSNLTQIKQPLAQFV